MGLVRLFTWIAGGSAALMLIYHVCPMSLSIWLYLKVRPQRYLLPRLARTQQARQALNSHHVELLRKLTTSLSSFKESQYESFSVLPRPISVTEHPKFKNCHTLDEIISTNGEKGSHLDIPEVSILRCAIEEFSMGNESRRPSTEELFQVMSSKLPWLQSDLAPKYQVIHALRLIVSYIF
jgi:hypothetical protein